ncbi:exodeoxyribonuclease VII large subunit [Dysgonomonas capnocytophagoides]|uniref:Exodeoxyribonuclease 7 large subunit n=1 Tax=Dysgonomonas capnocytophagoides TaxID=45254 RepID=A0A4Y8KW03_9BACT|nr:exodeoxyribonuclease VII large subunit [Dysgonomonas capnocytophagoides]TFD93802.1 exodeoxyribonuclease VII large subunit [Dysgonomonas capnocytophagoides]BES62371.1 exodeoxyribonuclease VII large subunit [Dysgonomonas capnocytophagoides]
MELPALSLYELNNLVRGVIADTFSQRFWIRAEMSDVRCNQNGHCYLEFIEKDSNNKTIIAKARGSIWSNVFRMLKAYFESETGQAFASGLKVLVQVSIEFHELYGYSLNVHDIDPSYTLGDQAKNRTLIIKQLEEEGVLDLNKELPLAKIANRIAVISSPTAAGYEDFCNQLTNNKDGFIFYNKLFPAIMQGDRTEQSIIAALDRIYENIDKFDAVVIIRGGGATSDLSSFDSYLLAANCAQFPLPIITGIGHERDDTVLDIVAHTRAKTPTAVAEFLIKHIYESASELIDIQDSIIFETNKRLIEEATILNTLVTKYSYIIKDRTKDQLNKLDIISEKIKNAAIRVLQDQKHILESKEQYIEHNSPENILKKGYTLTLSGKKIIKSKAGVKKGDNIVTRFADGEVESLVK